MEQVNFAYIKSVGFWPAGFYWPAGSSSPIPTPKGKFTPTPGSISPIEWYPGYFTLNVQSTSCLKCPNGFQCKGTGTSWPTICPVGDYRSSSESNACSLCPVGTFSFTRGAKDESEWLQCPEGRLWTQAGLTNVTQSTSWSDGSICNTASGARSTISCPIGFYCPSGTGISEMYNNMCPAGFYCNSGTGDGSKYNKKCPEGYYCPQATEAFSDFTGSGTDNVAPTIWPYSKHLLIHLSRNLSFYLLVIKLILNINIGTGKDNEDGKRELTDCGINSVDKLLGKYKAI